MRPEKLYLLDILEAAEAIFAVLSHQLLNCAQL